MREAVIKELSFVNSYDIHFICQDQQLRRVGNGSRANGILVMTHHFLFAVSGINQGLEDLNPLFGNFGAAQAADEFLGFSGKHGSADHFDPACPFTANMVVLEKHVFASKIRQLTAGEEAAFNDIQIFEKGNHVFRCIFEVMKQSLMLMAGILLLLTSCRKDAGEGGNAVISGRVMVEVRLLLNNPETVRFTAPAADRELYIIYGDGPGPDDRIRANYDGEFEFPYLREGEYEIYVYSKDTSDTAANGQSPENIAIRKRVTITDRKQELNIGDIVIYDDNF